MQRFIIWQLNEIKYRIKQLKSMKYETLIISKII